MLLSFSEGFLLGLGAAVPLGPINILIMNEAIKRYSSGVFVGLGAMSADMTYLLVIVFGLVGFIKYAIVLNILSIFGGSFLIYLSYAIFKNRDKILKTSTEKIKHSSRKSLYLKGFLLTLLNPYTIGFWLSASSFAATKELNIFVTVLGMFSAILLWVILMPYIVHNTKHKISFKVSYFISVISSGILLFFGLVMISKIS